MKPSNCSNLTRCLLARVFLLGTGLTSLALPAFSQSVSFFYVSKARNFVQTTNADAATLISGNPFTFEAAVEGTDLSAITAPTITTPSSTNFPAGFTDSMVNPTDWSYGADYPTLPGMNNVVGFGDFTITALGQGVTVSMPANPFPNGASGGVIGLSAGSISGGILSWDVSQPLTLSFTGAFDVLTLEVFGPGYSASDGGLGAASASVTIPAFSLTSGSNYTTNLYLTDIYGGSSLSTVVGGAMNGALYGGLFQTNTTFTISAIPEPSTYAAIAGLGALGLAWWRRRRQTPAR
jgi:hypothetical protein